MDKITLVVIAVISIVGGIIGYKIGTRSVDELKAQLADIKTASENAKAAAEAAKKAIDAGLSEQGEKFKIEIAAINTSAEARHAALSGYLNGVDKKLIALSTSRDGIDARIKNIDKQLATAIGEQRKRLEDERRKLEDEKTRLNITIQSSVCLQVPVDMAALKLAYSLQAKAD